MSIQSEQRIYRFVFTGGPCGGKTTAMSYIKQKLEQLGYYIIIVPEAATLCINGGISPINPVVGVRTAQYAITSLVQNLESVWWQAAQDLSSKFPVVVLHDRGIVDSAAYTPADLYVEILTSQGLHQVEVRDARYDAVFHLVTAAKGAENSYTLANNTARYETAEEARIQDEKIIGAWTGTPHLRAIDNSTDFEGKLHRLYQEVCQVLGIPIPIEFERRFIIRPNFPLSFHPGSAQRIAIEQTYLMSSRINEIVRVRERSQYGFSCYYHTTKRSMGDGAREEHERMITSAEYDFSLRFQLSGTSPVKKVRTCYMHEYQYFELDDFDDERAIGKNNLLLELELTDRNREIKLPAWMEANGEIREVTGDPYYSNFEISKRLAEV